MRNTLILFFFLTTTLTYSQGSRNKNLDAFSNLSITDSLTVKLIKSEVNRISIIGTNKNKIKINETQDSLKIRTKRKDSIGERTSIILYYKSLKSITANQYTTIDSDDIIEQDEITLITKEKAQIKVFLKVKTVNISSLTEGIITTLGKAENQNVEIFNGGVYKGHQLKTETTGLTIREKGNAYINARLLADIHISNGGNVYIYGKPKTIKEDNSFGGQVVEKKRALLYMMNHK